MDPLTDATKSDTPNNFTNYISYRATGLDIYRPFFDNAFRRWRRHSNLDSFYHLYFHAGFDCVFFDYIMGELALKKLWVSNIFSRISNIFAIATIAVLLMIVNSIH